MSPSKALDLFNQSRVAIPQHVGDFFSEEGSNIAEREVVPALGYEGKVWQITVNGEKTKLVKRNDEGDEEPLSTMRVIVLDYAKKRGRAYFEGVYNPDKAASPVCASEDGVTPLASIKAPQAAKCDACPMSVKGSKVTDAGKMVSACSQHRMVAVIPANNLGFTPLRMKLAVTSDYDKQSPEMEAQGWYAFTNYADMLRAKGVQHTAALVTKMKFDPNAAYPKVMFSPDRWLTAEEMAQVVPVVRGEAVQALLGRAVTPPPTLVDRVATRLEQAETEAVVPDEPPTPPVPEVPAAKRGRPPKPVAAPTPPPTKMVMDDDDDDAPAPAKKPAATSVSDDVASLLEEWGED